MTSNVEAVRRYRQTDKGRASALRQRIREVGSGRHAARQATYRAIKSGRLVRQPCWCGATKVQAHHPYGYEEHRLTVVWLCHQHHKDMHR